MLKIADEQNKIISDEEINTVWGSANFGNITKRDVIKYGLLKRTSGYHQGHTSTQILMELGLINKDFNLSKKGKLYLWTSFCDGSNF